jgi:type I restriction enzyme S subunit
MSKSAPKTPPSSKAQTGRHKPAQGKEPRDAALGLPSPQIQSPEGAGQMPRSWTKIRFDQACLKITDGTHHSPKIQHSDPGPNRFKYVTSKNIRPWGLDLDDLTYVDEHVHREIYSRCNPEHGDVLLTKDGVNTGVVAINTLNEEFSLLSSVAVLKIDHGLLEAKFLKHYITSPDGSRSLLGGMTGTAIRRIILRQINEATLPLPPLAEQKRIVSKIEELFSELDAGEESLRRARRQLGLYRQSLLKQAFEGKLTAPWRIQNPHLLESFAADDEISADELGTFAELPASWRYTRLGRFIQQIDAGKSFRCEERRPKPNEIGVAKVSAVTWGQYDEAESKTCIDPAKVNPSYFIREGDFLLSRANTIELVGACVLVRRVTQPIMLSDKTLRLSIDDERKSFILQYLRSHQGRREIEKRSTGNQESMRNIGQERIRSIVIPECTLPEQREIVRLLDEQFTVIEQNEREIDAALKRSAALRQSILKKAFTGQLVPQDPTDEPASALLERIQMERHASAAVPKKKTSR